MKRNFLIIIFIITILMCILSSCNSSDSLEQPTNKTEQTTTQPEQSTNKHEHKYGEWQISDSTCTVTGSKTRICECGEKETESIPLKEHSITSGICSVCKKVDDPRAALIAYVKTHGEFNGKSYSVYKVDSINNYDYTLLYNTQTDSLTFAMSDTDGTTSLLSLDYFVDMHTVGLIFSVSNTSYTVNGYIKASECIPHTLIDVYGMDGKVPSYLTETVPDLFIAFSSLLLNYLDEFLNDINIGITMPTLGFVNY